MVLLSQSVRMHMEIIERNTFAWDANGETEIEKTYKVLNPIKIIIIHIHRTLHKPESMLFYTKIYEYFPLLHVTLSFLFLFLISLGCGCVQPKNMICRK